MECGTGNVATVWDGEIAGMAGGLARVRASGHLGHLGYLRRVELKYSTAIALLETKVLISMLTGIQNKLHLQGLPYY